MNNHPDSCRKIVVLLVIISAGLFLDCAAKRNLLVFPDPKMDGGRPVPVKFYWLKQRHNFDNAGYEALWKDPKGTLKQDLLADPPIDRRAIPARPDTLKNLLMPKGTLFLGVVASYSEIADGKWKKIIIPNQKNIILKLGKEGIEIK